ncbi:MAG: hypothetical protein KOO63_05735 [Bacteroidales bacterium]|nr:hypothetical protein [Candidatus Latescibacterota bacterium]
MIDLTKFEGHTPGPWKAEMCLGRSYAIDAYSKGEIIFKELACVSGATESVANARLIAAAPDLLAEVERLRATLQGIANLKGMVPLLVLEKAQQLAAAELEGEDG